MITKTIKKRGVALLLGLLLPSFAALLAQEFSARLGESIVEQTVLGTDVEKFFRVVVFGLGGYAIAQVGWGLGKLFMNRTSTTLECEIKEAVYNKFLRTEYTNFMEKDRGTLYLNFNQDIQSVLSMFTDDLYDIIYGIIMGIGIFVLIFFRNFVVAVIVMFIVVVVIIINVFYLEKFQSAEEKERKVRKEGIGLVSQIINAKSLLRVLNLETITQEEYKKNSEAYYTVKQEQNKLELKKSLKLDWFVCSCATMILPVSCLMVSLGKIELTDVIYIVQLTGNVIWSTSSLGSSWISYNKKKVAFSSLEQLMQSPEDLEEEEGQIAPMGDIALSFENVFIRYKEYEPVKNLSFFCPKGTITVLVGESGIGKSSVFNAVLGFTEYSGKIKVWNKIVEKKNLKAVRHSISYMSEYNEMDEVTVEEAISFGEREISETEKKEYIKRLGLEKIKNVFDASGGEKQRISFIRTCLKKCGIYFFDEPTAALDEENEKIVLEFIKNLKRQGKTVLIITHRQKTKEIADQVIEFKNTSIL